MPLDRSAIVKFLVEELPEVKRSPDRLRLWFARLYATFVPNAQPKTRVHGDVLWSDHYKMINEAADRRVVLAWQVYLHDLNGSRREMRPIRLRTRIINRVPLELGDVTNEPRSIIAFLANRYHRVLMREPGAMREYILAFRMEFQLKPRSLDLHAQDIRMAFYQNTPRARRRVLTAWTECLEDLAARAPVIPELTGRME